jgi:hypothetical protein
VAFQGHVNNRTCHFRRQTSTGTRIGNGSVSDCITSNG